jgi:AcrR family transcriptional regulator
MPYEGAAPLPKQSQEDKKNFIAEVAAKVFSNKGYLSSSLQDVALAAGMSKAGLYHYFKSKEELLAFILLKNTDSFLHALRACIAENVQNGMAPKDSFKSLMQTYARHLNQDQDLRLIVLRERHQLSGQYKDELFAKEQELFRTLREELKKVPDVEEDLDLNAIIFLFISMSHWLGYWFKEGLPLGMDEIIDQNIRIILKGILKE